MSSEAVVFVPGVWMPGAELLYLKHQLERRYGFVGRLFSYASVLGTLDENAAKLAGCLRSVGTDTVHIVGHSLGGVLALRTCATHDELPPGRIVCLGSPLCGSRAAMFLKDQAWGDWLLGPTLKEAVIARAASLWARELTAVREVGIIAGTRAAGFGRLLVQFDDECDGTVAVSETRLEGARDHVCLPVSHTGMVLSPECARQTAAFLREGHFIHD